MTPAAWREALLLPGETDLGRSLLREASEFLGVPAADLAGRLAGIEAQLAADWRAMAPDRFYADNANYLLHLLAWHADHPRAGHILQVLDVARARGLRDFLDFGAGIGTTGIVFARGGLAVTLADIADLMLDFARWRFARRALPVRIVNLRASALPRSAFDLAMAFDVLEHIPDAAAPLRAIRDALRPGGRFHVEMGDLSPDEPSHVTSPEWVLARLRASGYVRERAGNLLLYRKAELSRFARARVALADRLRYAARRFVKDRPGLVRAYRALRRTSR